MSPKSSSYGFLGHFCSGARSSCTWPWILNLEIALLLYPSNQNYSRYSFIMSNRAKKTLIYSVSMFDTKTDTSIAWCAGMGGPNLSWPHNPIGQTLKTNSNLPLQILLLCICHIWYYLEETIYHCGASSKSKPGGSLYVNWISISTQDLTLKRCQVWLCNSYSPISTLKHQLA